MESNLQIMLAEPYEFDLITKIIIESQVNKNRIKREWKILLKFLEEFPEAIINGELLNCNGFKEYKIRQEFILDSHIKIYKQIANSLNINNPDLSPILINVFYYEYDPSLKQYWKRNNILLGDFDDMGRLNTGSALILKMLKIDWKLYLIHYYSILN